MDTSDNTLSPRTPKTPGSSNRENDKGHKRTLEQRRQLVMQLFQEYGLFPTAPETSNFLVRFFNCYLSVKCHIMGFKEINFDDFYFLIVFTHGNIPK